MTDEVPEEWRRLALAPPRAHGEPVLRGNLRVSPEDFEVFEELPFEPDGHGSHWLLRVVKRGANTEWVAGELARIAGVRAADVGYAGLKDRHAVASQWFSVPQSALTADAWRAVAHPEYRVLEAHAHGRKLRRGALAANRFRICIREPTGDAAALEERVATVARSGVPNYFGAQRFGRAGANLARVHHWSTTGALPGSRSERSFTISAARSLVFNAVLAERVDDGSWNSLVTGDIANLDGSGSIFPVDELTADLAERCQMLDLHPTGPLWGAGEVLSNAGVRELETEVSERFDLVAMALSAVGVNQERRALRLRVADLRAQFGTAVVTLEFRLGAGAFATTVLRELLQPTTEA